MRRNLLLGLVVCGVAAALWVEPSLAQSADDIASPLVSKTDEFIQVMLKWGQRIALLFAVFALVLSMTGRIAWHWFGGIAMGTIGLFLAEPIIGWLAAGGS
ncbi:ABC transporter permease/ATPase [Tepidicaulis marinus]|mgnify:CR=1 FL=1|uniref:ABC transporter permease/ATPase n=2 Tax=Tepidicaulis marinus TaxID=1333998 RepID=A0A081BF48_9HYPH|nr:TrbC/VirB2 family protein [Tepidicaulis marinus]GAK46666.1 ABC transporter permease/ATPase [Tepidicaulis marinus]